MRWSDLDLEGGWIQLRAEGTKSQRADALPLSPDLVDELQKRKLIVVTKGNIKYTLPTR